MLYLNSDNFLNYNSEILKSSDYRNYIYYFDSINMKYINLHLSSQITCFYNYFSKFYF